MVKTCSGATSRSSKREHSVVGGEGITQVLPIVDDTGKRQKPSYDSLENVGSTNTLIRTSEGGDKVDMPINRVDIDVGVDVNHHDDDNARGDKVVTLEKVSGCHMGMGVNSSVEHTSDETSYKYAKTHTFIDPTIAGILADLKGTKPEVDVDSLMENQDDDVVVVSYITSKSRRRTRVSVAALEKKRAALGSGGVDVEAAEEPEKAVDVEELERLSEKKKVPRKARQR
ncbi:hypothetical protein LIER_12467 [Lithospermum erythrorhizon]|uniref:Uncharacterized protein n=1 Tax=Lithospermum erythrorhizon TaxID=34254 RepID=A0AAV3PSK4_LITER